MYFMREYSLEIGRPFKKDAIKDPTKFPLADNPKSLFVKDLEIEFVINKVADKNLNTSKITITNLSNETYGFINTYASEAVYIVFKAGYKGKDLIPIFKGMLVGIEDRKEAEVRRTTLYISDGYTSAKEAVTVHTFPPGWPVRGIAERLRNDLGLPYGYYVPSDATTRGYYPISGSTKEAFAKLANDLGYTFSIQDNAVDFYPKNYEKPPQATMHINQRSGLVGEVVPVSDSSSSLQGDKITPTTGVSFTVLLDGNIKTGNIVYITSRRFQGYFKIEKVRHEGDYRGNTWFTVCQASQVSPFISGDTEAVSTGSRRPIDAIASDALDVEK